MKVSYAEGLANHNGPESCGAAREGGVEALAGGRTGRVLSREIYALLRKRQVVRDADAVEDVGRQYRAHRHRKVGSDPARSGSQRTNSDDERTWEVGQPRQTCEVAEQSRGTGSGGDGGKGAGQGKLARTSDPYARVCLTSATTARLAAAPAKR